MSVHPEKFIEQIRKGRLFIEGRDGSAQSFTPYPWQEQNNTRWLRNRLKGRFTYEIWLKGRQPGATTDAICGNIADAMTRRQKSLIVATSDDMIDIVWDKAKLACFGPDLSEVDEDDEDIFVDDDGPKAEAKPKRKKPKVNQKRFVVPVTGSVVRIRNERGVARKGAQKSVARGGTFQTALFTEIDLWKDFGKTYDALIPSIAQADPFGRLVMESTLEPGGSAEYREFIRKALANPHGQWHVAFTAWYNVPDYAIKPSKSEREDIERDLSPTERDLLAAGATVENLHWRRIQCDIMGGEDRFERIHPSTAEQCLDSIEGNLFDGRTHAWLEDGVRPPIRRRWAGHVGGSPMVMDVRPMGAEGDDETSPFADLFAVPGTGKRYSMGIDTADASQAATRGSESAIVITDKDTGDQVCEWHGFVDPHVCAAAAVGLARYFNNATVVLEMDAAGKAVLAFMRGVYHYEHYYMREVIDRRTKQQVSMIGFDARDKTNARLMSEFVKLVKTCQAKNYSAILTDQVLKLSQRGGEWTDKQSITGIRDDVARAWALSMIGCEKRDHWPVQPIRLKHADHIIVDQRTGLTWGDLERAERNVDESSSYPGIIRI